MSANSNRREQLSRIAAMSWDEIRVRATQESCKRWDLARARLPKFAARRTGARFACRGRFFFQADDVPASIDCLLRTLPDIAQHIIQSADRILEHKFNLLGYQEIDYGREIDWHFDAVHGKSSPRLPWFRVPFLDFDRVGDHKIIWELNRHQHLVTLAKAYRLTGNSNYTDELFTQWYSWQQHNPYPMGINWASSLEVAFRSLSWLWVWFLLEGTPALPRRFAFDLLPVLMRSGRYVERFLSTYFAPNTHLIGEAVALFFIGSLTSQSRSAMRWQELGWQILLHEAKRQVLPDGMHFEQSTYYHVYALDFFLHARVLADMNGIAVPPEFDETVAKMLDVLRVLGQSGTLPQFGDDDGGRVFDAARNGRNHMFDPLAIGAVLFHRADLKAAVGAPTEELLWLLGKGGIEAFDALGPVEGEISSANLPASGLYVMSGSGAQQLTIDAGPQGRGWAGHGHADALSIQLSVQNKHILADPGTCSYVDAKGERAYFRATNSHSTVEIDGVSQARPSGSFKWSALAHATADRWISNAGFDFFIGSHRGYERLLSPVIHQRTVFYLKPQFWVVRDVLKGTGSHRIDVSWNFAPGSLTTVSDRAYFEGRDGGRLTGLFCATKEFSIEKTDGWYSERYGHKEASPLLRLSAKVQLPAEFTTILLPTIDRNARLASTNAYAEQEVRGYRLTVEGRSHEIFFAESGSNWRSGALASDARFVYASRPSRRGYDRFAIVDGSFTEVDGDRVFSSEERIEGKEWRVASQPSVKHHPPLFERLDLSAGAIEEEISRNI